MNNIKHLFCIFAAFSVLFVYGFLQAEEVQKDKILVLEPIWNIALVESEKAPIFEMIKAEAETSSQKIIVTKKSIKNQEEQAELSCDFDNLECLSNIGALAGASLVLFASVDRVGDIWMLNVKLFDVATKTVIKRSSKKTVQKVKSLVIGFTRAIKDIFDVKYIAKKPVVKSAQESLDLSKWPYTFTKDEIETLKKSGALFSELEKNVAQRIYYRGFSKDEYIQAFKDLFTIKFINDPLLLEELVVFRYLGLAIQNYQEYHNYWKYYGHTLATYYNRNIHGGRGLVAGGWVMVGSGLVTTILGATVFRTMEFDSCTSNFDPDECQRDLDAQKVMWPILTAVGVGLTAGGVAMATVGHMKLKKWAKSGFFISATKEKIKAYKLGIISGSGGDDVYVPEQEESKPSISIAPVITSDTKGAFFELRF